MYSSKHSLYLAVTIALNVLTLIVGSAIIIYVPWAWVLGLAMVLSVPLSFASMFHPFYADLIFRAIRGARMKMLLLIGRGKMSHTSPWGKCTVDFAEGVEVCEAASGYAAYVRLLLFPKPPSPSNEKDAEAKKAEEIAIAVRALLSILRNLDIEVMAVPDFETKKLVEEKMKSLDTKSGAGWLEHRHDVLRKLLELSSKGMIVRYAMIVTVSGEAYDPKEAIRRAKTAALSASTAFNQYFDVKIAKGRDLAVYLITRHFRPPASYEEAMQILEPLFSKSGMR